MDSGRSQPLQLHGRLLLDSLAEGVVLQSADGRVIDANTAAAPILGLTHEDLLGRTSRDPRWYAIHEDGRPWPGDEHPAMVALRTGVTQRDIIMGIMVPDSGRRWICIHSVPLSDGEGGVPTGVVSSFADVTPHIDLRNRLAAANRELNELYDEAPCGYHTLDPHGFYQRINDTELEWLGVSREFVLGRLGPLDFLSEDSKETFRSHFPQLLAGKSLEGLELELIGAQGQRRFVRLSARPVFDGQGQFLSTRSVIHDITESRARAFALAKLSAEQAVALDNDLISIVRLRDRRIVWSNRAFDRIFGYAHGELLGRTTERLFPSEDAYRDFGSEVYPKLKAGEPFRAQISLRRKDGAAVWTDCSGFMIDPATAEVMWFALDLTQAHEAQQMRIKAVALEAENLRLQETARLHRLFLANISHELRTPLNAIIGFSDLLRVRRERIDADTVQRYGDRISTSGRHLLSMIDTVLEMAKAEAGRPILNPVEVDLVDALRDAIALLQTKAMERDVTVEAEVPADMPPVCVDPLRLQQVMVQLIDNAIKFSHRGGTVWVRVQPGDQATFRFEVEDRGIGIHADDVGRLFGSFQQISTGNSKSHGGMGLGLAMVKWLVEAQNGGVRVNSTPGVGSVFCVTMPRNCAP